VVVDYVALSVMGRGVTKALTIRDETFNYYAALQAIFFPKSTDSNFSTLA
jgi:hypothetical protein